MKKRYFWPLVFLVALAIIAIRLAPMYFSPPKSISPYREDWERNLNLDEDPQGEPAEIGQRLSPKSIESARPVPSAAPSAPTSSLHAVRGYRPSGSVEHIGSPDVQAAAATHSGDGGENGETVSSDTPSPERFPSADAEMSPLPYEEELPFEEEEIDADVPDDPYSPANY